MFITAEKSHNGFRREIEIPESSNKIVYANHMYYLVSSSGKIISKRQYGHIYKFVNGLAVVKRDEKKGVITINGEEILPPQYDNVFVDNHAIRICMGEKWGIADFHGKIIKKPFCNFIESFKKSVSRYQDENNNWGVINSKGKVIINAWYTYLGDLNKKIIVAMRFSKYGGIDLHENVLIPFNYMHMRIDEQQTILFNSEKDKLIV